MSLDFTQYVPKAAVGLAEAIARDYGAPVPQKLLDGMAELERLGAGVAPAAPPGNIGDLLIEHAINGTDPLDDEQIKRHALAHIINTAAPHEQIEQSLSPRRRALVKEHAPALIESWAQLIGQAEATLTRAREEIPALDLDAPHTVAALKPGQMTLWGEAREARIMAGRVVEAWGLIVTAARLAPVDDNTRHWVYTDPTPAQLRAVQRPVTPDSVIAAGVPLTLATPSEFMDRVARGRQPATTPEQASSHTGGPTVARVTPFGAVEVM